MHLTGANDHEIRKSLAKLATEPTSPGEPNTNPDGYADDLESDSLQSDKTGDGHPPVSPALAKLGVQ